MFAECMNEIGWNGDGEGGQGMFRLSLGFLVWEIELVVLLLTELGISGGAPVGEVERAEVGISALYSFDLPLNYLSGIFRGG